MTDKFLKIIFTITALIFITNISLFSLSGYSLSIHIKVSELKEAKSPMFIDNRILFTYSVSNKFVRRVAIAFEYDNYRQVYPFMKNEFNVFFMVKEIPRGTEYLNYRLIVDGVWMDDPVNSNSSLSQERVRVSRIDIPHNFSEEAVSPVIENNRNVKFIYKDIAEKHVYLTGNFNNWDPFMLRMEEDIVNPGTYSISLRMAEGNHFYKFVADGVSLQDPNNPRTAYDSRGNAVSIIKID